jgi:hypothetical protein
MKFRQLPVSGGDTSPRANWQDIIDSVAAGGSDRLEFYKVWSHRCEPLGVNIWLDYLLDSRLVEMEASLDNLRGLETS